MLLNKLPNGFLEVIREAADKPCKSESVFLYNLKEHLNKYTRTKVFCKRRMMADGLSNNPRRHYIRTINKTSSGYTAFYNNNPEQHKLHVQFNKGRVVVAVCQVKIKETKDVR